MFKLIRIQTFLTLLSLCVPSIAFAQRVTLLCDLESARYSTSRQSATEYSRKQQTVVFDESGYCNFDGYPIATCNINAQEISLVWKDGNNVTYRVNRSTGIYTVPLLMPAGSGEYTHAEKYVCKKQTQKF